ncbi:hypothetical protein FGO68_gene16308 [Halteria grandinella]|uniref:Uncharacterized protein n=1 Tax=Halteria grandinella TaxID=5974 RepID=A0A8J8ND10_HALGN|nr:hypothetical protein FGO68_gene16308 [Halteria grandinella]
MKRFEKAMKTIGAIPNCTLIDNDSVFRFKWIYQFITFASQQNNQYPPIQLKISKFRDNSQNCPKQDIQNHIIKIANENKLDIEFIQTNEKRVTIFHLRRKYLRGRTVTLFVDQGRQGNLFEINGVNYNLWQVLK